MVWSAYCLYYPWLFFQISYKTDKPIQADGKEADLYWVSYKAPRLVIILENHGPDLKFIPNQLRIDIHIMVTVYYWTILFIIIYLCTDNTAFQGVQ